MSADTLSGALQSSGTVLPLIGTLSNGFRALTLLVIMALLVRHRIRRATTCLILVSLALIFSLFHELYFGSNLITGLHFQIKLLFPIFLYFAISLQISHSQLTPDRVVKIVYVNGLIICAQLSLSLWGIGTPSYGFSNEGQLIGNKGFIYAGNELGVSIVALSALYIFFVVRRNVRVTWNICATVMVALACGLIMASKTVVIGVILVAMISFFSLDSARDKFRVLILMACSLVGLLIAISPFIKIAFDRWIYLKNNNSLTDFVTSGRWDRAAQFFDDLSAIKLLFGEGFEPGGGSTFFEIDSLDLLQSNGAFGALILCFWFAWFVGSLKALISQNNFFNFFRLGSLTIIIGISFLAGHVFYSGMLAPFVIFLIVLPTFQNEVFHTRSYR